MWSNSGADGVGGGGPGGPGPPPPHGAPHSHSSRLYHHPRHPISGVLTLDSVHILD